jgi:FMN phosphatase YigB (HAD superfamily)
MSQPTSIDWTKIKALTFDIYGTLVDWDAGVIRAARATALGPYLPSDEEFLGAVEEHHARIEREQPRMRKSEINAEGLRAYAADLGVVKGGKLTEEDVEEAAKQFGGSIGQFEAFDDTVMLQSFSNEPHRFIELTQAKVNAIQRLSKHFKILVPLTNMDHASYNGTLSGPLNGCPFTTSYIAEDIGSYKPNLANFHYLFDHLKADYGVEKNDICHVAQSLFHDHEPSKKVDLRSVWIDRYGIFQGMNREWEDVQKEYGMKGRVGSLGELADLVEKVLESS